MSELLAVIKGLDYSPLVISLKTGVVATIISFFMGLFVAAKILKLRGRLRHLADSIFTLPMVLPPTAIGFLLLLLFSKRRPLGIFLYEHFGIKIVQSFAGCVIAAFVIAFPIMYKNAKAAFELVDVNLVYAGRTMGMSEFEIFWKIVIPNSGPGILSGTILSFARAVGEYGATSMLAGNIPGKTATISQRIAMVIQDGDYMSVGVWVAIVMAMSFVIVFAMNLLADKKMLHIRRW